MFLKRINHQTLNNIWKLETSIITSSITRIYKLTTSMATPSIYLYSKAKSKPLPSSPFCKSFYQLQTKLNPKLLPNIEDSSIVPLQQATIQKLQEASSIFLLKDRQVKQMLQRLQYYNNIKDEVIIKKIEEMNSQLIRQILDGLIKQSIIQKLIYIIKYCLDKQGRRVEYELFIDEFIAKIQTFIQSNNGQKIMNGILRVIFEVQNNNFNDIFRQKYIDFYIKTSNRTTNKQGHSNNQKDQSSISLTMPQKIYLLFNIILKNQNLDTPNLQNLSLIHHELTKHSQSPSFLQTSIKFIQHIFKIKQRYETYNPAFKATFQTLLKNILQNRQLNLIFFYYSMQNGYKINELFQPNIFLPFNELNKLNKFLVVFILNNIVQYDNSFIKQYKQIKELIIKQQLADLVSYLNTFNQLQIYSLTNYHIHFHFTFHTHFLTFQNIFQNQYSKPSTTHTPFLKSNPLNLLKASFLNYFIKNYHFSQRKIFLKRYKTQITVPILQECLLLHLNQIQFNPNQYYNKLLLYKFPQLLLQKSSNLLSIGLLYIQKYIKYIINHNNKDYTQFIQKKIWHLIQLYIENIVYMPKQNIFQQLINILQSLINNLNNNINYKADQYYSSLIKKILSKIIFFKDSKIYKIIIQYALDVNLLTKEFIKQHIQMLEESNLEYHQLIKIKTIGFLKIDIGRIINKQMLHIFFYNDLYRHEREKYRDQIRNLVLEQADIGLLLQYLTAFNLNINNNKDDRDFHQCIFQAIRKKIRPEDIKMIHIQVIFQKAFRNKWIYLRQYHFLAQFIINNQKETLQRLPLFVHNSLLTYILSIKPQWTSKSTIQGYLSFLMQQLRTKYLYLASKFDILYKISCLNYTYSHSELQKIISYSKLTTIKYNFIQTFYILMLIDSAIDNRHLLQITKQYNEHNKNKKYIIFDLQLLYFQLYHPISYERLNLKNIHIYYENLSNKHPRLYHRIISKIQQTLNTKSQKLQFLSTWNILFKINKTILFCIAPQKNGAQRYLSFLQKQRYQLVFIKYYSNDSYVDDFLDGVKQNSSLLDEEQLEEIRAYFQYSKKLHILALESERNFQVNQDQEEMEDLGMRTFKLLQEDSQDSHQQHLL